MMLACSAIAAARSRTTVLQIKKPALDNEGIVNKIIGDAVMAVFGLGSDEGPDHKRRAIETGIEMIARI
jgi:class 3 adenylate cyclase